MKVMDHNVRSAFRDKVLIMVMCSEASEDCTVFSDSEGGSTWERGRSTMEGLAQSVSRQTSLHALRWDGCLVESQEGLEIKVGLRAKLANAPGSVAWFYMNRECGGYGIERS
ncbi:hypothetical protein M9H77_23729 [Catharanthus roseus]|uniref:Uncharacterized protein n=1 Tax=Catharanthus roseus TaxID=4058 RepID=A0ACC0AUJ7_CATRO|nr:hypothetical protein M9H77_23729 [Catharanthus roseus]